MNKQVQAHTDKDKQASTASPPNDLRYTVTQARVDRKSIGKASKAGGGQGKASEGQGRASEAPLSQHARPEKGREPGEGAGPGLAGFIPPLGRTFTKDTSARPAQSKRLVTPSRKALEKGEVGTLAELACAECGRLAEGFIYVPVCKPLCAECSKKYKNPTKK